LLAIAAVLSSSCSREPGTTPSSNPAKDAETIIVIKGGSVGVGFGKKYIAEPQPTPKHFECADCNFIGFSTGPDEYNQTPCDTDKNSIIHIKVQGGGKKDILIKKKLNTTKGIIIDLDTEEYPFDAGTNMYLNKNNVLDNVEVSPHSVCKCPVDSPGKCVIRIRTSPY
jgi:hypothetical protein